LFTEFFVFIMTLYRCYCRALSLDPNNSLMWHDLANVYHLQANFLKPSAMKKQLREYALVAVKKSILLNPRNWQHWNLLGVIASSVGMCYEGS
jgi:Flp pilus assembly protein TadD